jgi:DNA-binding transcriptional LysR family regulator
MELRQLRYFIAVAEERHFGRAADRLGIAQPGLSQQIKALERLLGVQLFIRKASGVELTEAGMALLPQARLLIEQADRAVESMRLATTDKKGLIRVGTRAVGNPPKVNELLREFQVRFPDVEMEIFPGFSPQSIQALTRRTLDVAIVLAPFESTETPRFLRLGEVELQVALPEGHRLASLDRIPRSELLKEPFVDWPRSVNPRMVDHVHRMLFGESQHPRPVMLADVFEGNRLAFVAEGGGVAVTEWPSMEVLKVHGVVSRRVEEPAPVVEFGIVWFDTHASPFVQAFVDLARAIAARS